MLKILGAVLILGASAALGGSAVAQEASGLKVLSRLAGPDGHWDYARFDPEHRRVLIAHGMDVLTVDADTGAVTPNFATGNHLHAVVAIPGGKLLVTTNSGDNTAKVIDAKDGHLIASLPTADDADDAVWDPNTNLLAVMGGDSGVITLIDPRSRTVAGSISIGQKLEAADVEEGGWVYADLVAANEIVAVDIAGRKPLGTIPLPGCVGPTGLAAVEGHRLIAACANGVTDIVDPTTTNLVATLHTGARPDAVIYDASRHVAYVPSGLAGTLSVIALAGPHNNTVIETVPTQRGARTGAVDPKTGRVYLPVAEYLPPEKPGDRPTVKPGTFQILVVGKE